MSHFKSELRAALLAAGLLAATPALYAQAQEEATTPEPATSPEPATAAEPATTDPSNTTANTTASAPVTDTKIDQFATAYVAVQHIQAKTSQELSTTTDVSKANEVKAAAETEMIKAVEQSGLQVDEFNQIAQLMASDEGLRTKVIEKVQEKS